VRFSNWELQAVQLGGMWRHRVGVPRWSSLRPNEVEALLNSHSYATMLGPDAPQAKATSEQFIAYALAGPPPAQGSP